MDEPSAGLTLTWRLNPTPEKPGKQRSRTWAPKARSGCLTCKRRKVKCDEGKPSCKRCVRAGWNCAGYDPPKAWMFAINEGIPEDSSPGPEVATRGSPHGGLACSPSYWAHGLDVNELRALEFWSQKTVPILTTFASVSHFWRNTIIQASLSSDAIRSAIIAAASLQEVVQHRITDQFSSTPSRLYTKHYAKAINTLTQAERALDPAVVLITCLIFLVCENLRNINSTALIHIDSGLKVLREYKRTSQRSTISSTADSVQDIVSNYLEPIFARLEGQKVLLPNDHASTQPKDFQRYDLNWSTPVIPSTFVDLFSARDALNDIVQYGWYISQQEAGPLRANTPRYMSLISLFTTWQRTLKLSFPLHENKSWPGYTTSVALRAHWHTLRLAVMAEGYDSSQVWDDHENEVEWTLDVCSTIVLSGPPTIEKENELWLYDFCLTPPLLLIGEYCRDPSLRRRAVHLMRMQHCWNNNEPFDACGSAKVIDMIMDIEERGLSGISTATDIPDDHRIRPMTLSYAVPGQITLNYTRTPHTKIESETIQWKYWVPSPIKELRKWPLSEQVKMGDLQGLIRQPRRSCLCRTLGAATDGTVVKDKISTDGSDARLSVEDEDDT